MLKKLGIPTLALATVMAVAAPGMSLAAGRDDHGNNNRGNGTEHHEVARGQDDHDARFRGGDRDRDNGRFSFGLGFYSAPARVVVAPPAPVPPAAAGYYDQYGVWHPYGYYDQFGMWHTY
jgi:hypothetical protein